MALVQVDPPIIVPNDVDQILAESVALYESLSGRTLQPAQVERLIINDWAYREGVTRAQMQSAVLQCFIRFASAPILDYLVEFYGVKRLPAATAFCTLSVVVNPSVNPLLIPAGWRVETTGGLQVFTADVDTTIPPGTSNVQITATCTVEGVGGNNYTAGKVSVILDPLAFVATVTNTGTTSGGSDIESNDALRERALLAPSSFSVAGPTGAYKYFAKTANPLIIDVSAISFIPGKANIYPMIAGGITPQHILDDVYAILNPDDIRPLCDTVVVQSPTQTSYAIMIELILLTGSDVLAVEAAVEQAATIYAAIRSLQLGLDIVPDQIKRTCGRDASIYKLNVISPPADIVQDLTQFAICTGITVTTTGFQDA
jgi:phage-related baseplate assembly protein